MRAGGLRELKKTQTRQLIADTAASLFRDQGYDEVTVDEIVGMILAQVGRTDLEPIVQDNAPNEIQAQYLDPSKAHRVLGWNPSRPSLIDQLRAGMAAFITVPK